MQIRLEMHTFYPTPAARHQPKFLPLGKFHRFYATKKVRDDKPSLLTPPPKYESLDACFVSMNCLLQDHLLQPLRRQLAMLILALSTNQRRQDIMCEKLRRVGMGNLLFMV